jgi:hypothetical protein
MCETACAGNLFLSCLSWSGLLVAHILRRERQGGRAELRSCVREMLRSGLVSMAGASATTVTDTRDLTITHLDFSQGAPRLFPPRNDDIIIIDGFWSDPWSLRAAALAAPFQSQISTSGFVFHEWRSSPSHTRRMAELVSRACGEQLLHSRFQSRFVFETEVDERETRKKVWIHYDRWQRVGVLYLVPDELARGGTGFYRHRTTNASSVHEADALGIRPLVMADSSRDECWELLTMVPMRFNRMVVFRPHFFHQAIEYFGTGREDGRLYCIVAFDNGSGASGEQK